MAPKRSYGDACAVARALDVVGERWTLMIVRELLLGPKRFTDIRTGLPSLSPDVLAQRLRDLEAAGVLERRTIPPPAASQVYVLTPKGLALEPVIIALGRWGGANAPPPADGMGMSVDAHVISLRTLFDPSLAADLQARVQLRLGEERFRVEIADGQIAADRGELADPDVIVESDAPTLRALLHGRRGLAEAIASGDAGVEGDREILARFLRLFPIPAAAA